MQQSSNDSYKTKKSLEAAGKTYQYFSLPELQSQVSSDISRLPYSLKVLLENLLRNENGKSVTKTDITDFCQWIDKQKSTKEIAYHPARVLMQDFTGVPGVVDLATMRDAIVKLGGDPKKINPLTPVDLVIDHSVSVEKFGSESSFQENVQIEFERNKERYSFLKWGQKAFDNFRVVPPGTGICHQVNLEYLGQVVWTKDQGGEQYAYPDTLVGTDSHTTMINGLSVLGWGVGGIEAEAAMLGQAVTMLIPEVIGFKLTGTLAEGSTATDLVLTVVQMLRKKGVVGKFVEFYGPGLANLSLADRATLANMAPEYGATCGFFPIDKETINYLNKTGRDEDRVALVEAYAKAQGMWWEEGTPDPLFTDTLELKLEDVVPSLAGPKRPQDRIELPRVAEQFQKDLEGEFKVENKAAISEVEGKDYALSHGNIVLAAITSCTNTSNPDVMVAAGLVAKKARAKGLSVKPWVKTSLAPGSQVVTEYLEATGLQPELDGLGFNLVGYGCTTCIGNSGPLPTEIADAIHKQDLVACSVLSGNRNFEGRIGPDIRANYLASPPLVVAYAIAGKITLDLKTEPLGKDQNGNDVFLSDIWPSNAEIKDAVAKAVTREMFLKRYSDVFKGPEDWQKITVDGGMTYNWQEQSTYVKCAPFFEGMTKATEDLKNVEGAKILALLGDSVTTDHISPAGVIDPNGPAGKYLKNRDVGVKDFNSFGSRRGNHEVMMRGTFANIRLRNEMAEGKVGGWTKTFPEGDITSIYEAAMKYKADGRDLVVFGGKEYGTGSSRDWAAKGTRLLGVKAVVAESFERIHRSNLIGMGVLPLQFKDGQSWKELGLKGDETVSLSGLAEGLTPGMTVKATIEYTNGESKSVELLTRVDTLDEIDYFKNGGILHYVLRNLAQ